MSELTIRPEEEADRAAVRRVAVAAFGDEGELIASLLEALEGDRRLSLVAEQDGEVVGHVLLSRSWVDAREELVEVLVLSPVSVSPERQGEGIGGALVRASLEAADAEGWSAVFLEGGPGFYGRHGFERASAHGFVRPSVRIPDPACQVALLRSHEPWMVGALVYCDAFWELDAVGLRGDVLTAVEESLGG